MSSPEWPSVDAVSSGMSSDSVVLQGERGWGVRPALVSVAVVAFGRKMDMVLVRGMLVAETSCGRCGTVNTRLFTPRVRHVPTETAVPRWTEG